MTDNFSDLSKQWEKGMKDWWDKALASPSFWSGMTKAMGQNGSLYEKQIEKFLNDLHIPTKTDMSQLARVCTLLGDRVEQLEKQLGQMNDKISSMEKEVLQARLEAAQAKLAIKEKQEQ